MWSINLMLSYQIIAVFITNKQGACNPIATNFNDRIRDYSVKSDHDTNSTNVRTLQKEDLSRYANFSPIHNPIRFKEVPDNALSSSSHSRLLHHDHLGYGLHDYDDSSHHGYGYDYHLPDSNLHNGYDQQHYPGHHGGHHHVGYGLHHKHYDHGLATKSLLWPIAGIALLGAAAALASNPVLLQLGVISGRRRRRDAAELSETNFDLKSLTKWTKYSDKRDGFEALSNMEDSFKRKLLKKRVIKDAKRRVLSLKAYPTVQSSIQTVTLAAPQRHHWDFDDNKFVPIPLVKKT